MRSNKIKRTRRGNAQRKTMRRKTQKRKNMRRKTQKRKTQKRKTQKRKTQRRKRMKRLRGGTDPDGSLEVPAEELEGRARAQEAEDERMQLQTEAEGIKGYGNLSGFPTDEKRATNVRQIALFLKRCVIALDRPVASIDDIDFAVGAGASLTGPQKNALMVEYEEDEDWVNGVSELAFLEIKKANTGLDPEQEDRLNDLSIWIDGIEWRTPTEDANDKRMEAKKAKKKKNKKK